MIGVGVVVFWVRMDQVDGGSTDWVIIDEHVCGVDPVSRWFHPHANDEFEKKVRDV